MKTSSIGCYLSSDFRSAVVVPCYKEEKRLNPQRYVDGLKDFSSHVFLVDDGSPDGTLGVLERLHKSAPDRFSVIKAPHQGKAETVRLGLNTAVDKNFRHVGFLDADLAVDFKEVPDFLKVFKDKKDVTAVIGTRTRLAGREIDRSLPKYLQQRIIAWMGGLLFSPKVQDTQCGAKMFEAKTLGKAIKKPFVTNWLFDQELLTRMSRLKENEGKNWLFELPVKKWTDVANSTRSVGSYASALKDYFMLVKKYGFRK